MIGLESMVQYEFFQTLRSIIYLEKIGQSISIPVTEITHLGGSTNKKNK